eukprot:3644797-Amphidinium_carterae.1
MAMCSSAPPKVILKDHLSKCNMFDTYEMSASLLLIFAPWQLFISMAEPRRFRLRRCSFNLLNHHLEDS